MISTPSEFLPQSGMGSDSKRYITEVVQSVVDLKKQSLSSSILLFEFK